MFRLNVHVHVNYTVYSGVFISYAYLLRLFVLLKIKKGL